jgi:hypothetical protein
MVQRKVLTLTAVLLAGATFAAPAVATPTVVDQYTEQIPTPGGQAPGQVVDRPVSGQGSPGGGQAGAPGDSGAASGSPVASDTAVTPPGVPGSSPGGPGSSGASGGDVSRPASGEPTSGAGAGPSASFGGASPVQGGGPDGGLGILFPVALLLIGGLTAAAVLSRRAAGGRVGTG